MASIWIKNARVIDPAATRDARGDLCLADGERSVILEQVTNGIAVRMAVLYLCAGGQPEHVAPVE